MRSLLNFFLRYSSVLIFLVLQAVAIYLLYNGTSYHNIRLANGVGAIQGRLQQKVRNTTEYFSLRQVNLSLEAENLELRNRLEGIIETREIEFFEVNDSMHRQQYKYIAASVVNQTVNRQKNYITINMGTNHGIKPGMAVTGSEGIVGIVVGASQNFSVAMSTLNLDFRLSARLRNSSYFGSLAWDGHNREQASLREIPHHVVVAEGDTVETSGFSSIFPAGIIVGTVASVNSETGDFLNITINLSTNFSKLHNVYIIGNLLKEEQERIEDGTLKNSTQGND